MAELSVQSISRDGLNPSLSSASSGGDKFLWDARRFIEVDNASASSIDVTVVSQYSNDPQGLSSSDLTVTVPDGERRLIGPFSDRAFEDGDGYVNITYSSTSSVNVGVFEV